MPPSYRLLLSHPAHFISLGFGAGLAPRAPGTAGTLVAWLLYPLLRAPISDFVFLALLASFFVAGLIAADRTGRALGVPDHGAIVWDEIVAFWLVLFFTPASLLWQSLAFVLFRFFDIVKPQPIRWVDSRIKGGLGVMLDDVIAAGYAILALALLVRFFG
ncbi:MULTISPECIES: phosphatidylglycerophosphatase A family protein [Aromatoleum]|uniref:Phosphatidylglycerophosphatase A n=2 Tax=Aromatoleum TaxID=551759 RepID=A0ABX1NUT1_9RHOO|nr:MULTISPECIES: phosphatidylglycerophosphatase A [Aromatoleum]MCK0507327.1 phosphatidylglycerophosphatase A [Aromatoleum anaerobium]NMG15528.1 phosphatidylglycerophosphatase A [Aromatoleum bremense]QTQ31566.1 Phosphatidylglycerophosphatase A [Aromatoleum bremense]